MLMVTTIDFLKKCYDFDLKGQGRPRFFYHTVK